jgi:hypothetical protein
MKFVVPAGMVTDLGGGKVKITLGSISYATPALTLGTANAPGSAASLIRSDATILAFDTTVPSTQNYGDAAAVGVATVAARRDHKHGMPAEVPSSFIYATNAAAAAVSAGSQPNAVTTTPTLAAGTYFVFGRVWVDDCWAGAIDLYFGATLLDRSDGRTRNGVGVGWRPLQGVVTHAGGAVTVKISTEWEADYGEGNGAVNGAGDTRWQASVVAIRIGP